jgi:hypothetical protein
MMKKRGQMDIGILFALIFGGLALAFVIWGFATNWSLFSSLFPAGNTVTAVVTNCQSSCATSDNYGFCKTNRTLQAPDLPNDINGKAQKQVIDTCNYFSSNPAFSKYNVVACPSIVCS